MDLTLPTLPGRAEFQSAIGCDFAAELGGDGTVAFRLVDCKSIASSERHECFSLMFRAPADTAPVQDVYRLNTAELGAMELFLVPVKRDESGVYFEAVMNFIS